MGFFGDSAGPTGALRASSGPSDDDVTQPELSNIEFCLREINFSPLGSSVPTGDFWAYWPLTGSRGPAGLWCLAGSFEGLRVPLEPYVPAMSEPFEPHCSSSNLTICPRARLSLLGPLVSDGGCAEETV